MAGINVDNEQSDIYKKINQIKNTIETNFSRIISIVEAKKISILQQLDNIYEQVDSEWTIYNEHLNKLTEHYTSTETRFKSNEMQEISTLQLTLIAEEIENFKKCEPSHSLNFTWNSDIENILYHIAHISFAHENSYDKRVLLVSPCASPTRKYSRENSDSIKVLNSEQFKTLTISEKVSDLEIDYKSKEKPTFSFGLKGTGQAQMNGIRGITIDSTTNQLYVVDRENNRVQIFSMHGEFIKVFGHFSSTCYRMNQPEAICIWQDLVYISQKGSDCIQMYSNIGSLIKTAGFKGSEEGMFIHPWGMAVKDDGSMLIVCDSGNHRIQVFDIYLNFKFAFGYSVLRYPRDVKLYKKSVFVLDFGNYCVKEFDQNLSYLRNFVGRGSFAYLLSPTFMTIDSQGNLLLPCWERSQVYVYSQKDELLHILQASQSGPVTSIYKYVKGISNDYGYMYQPTGICIDKQNRVIVGNYQNAEHCIQYF